jgi:hypothetical protein
VSRSCQGLITPCRHAEMAIGRTPAPIRPPRPRREWPIEALEQGQRALATIKVGDCGVGTQVLAAAAGRLNAFFLKLRDLLRGVRVLLAFQAAAWLSLWVPQGSEVYVMEARSLANLLSLAAACLIFATCLFVCARAQIMPSLGHVATPIEGFRSRLPAFMSGLFLLVAAVLVWRGLRSSLDLADDPTKGLMILKMGRLGGCAPVAFGHTQDPAQGRDCRISCKGPVPVALWPS